MAGADRRNRTCPVRRRSSPTTCASRAKCSTARRGCIQTGSGTSIRPSAATLRATRSGSWGGSYSTYAYTNGNPISLIDPYGLWWFGDPLPQGLVDFSAGAGDAALATISFGLISGQGIRNSLGICSVNSGSWEYVGGQVTGTALTLAALAGGGIPGTLTPYTTAEGAAAIAESGEVLGGQGLFGEGVYATSTGSRFNPFVPPGSTVPIGVSGDGFIRVIPSLVFLKGNPNLLTKFLSAAYGTAANINASRKGNCSCSSN